MTTWVGDTERINIFMEDSKNVLESTTASTSKNITGATKAEPCVLSMASGDDLTFVEGDLVIIAGITGMTELNSNTYRVDRSVDTAVTIDVDSSAFTEYVSGGTISLVPRDSGTISAITKAASAVCTVGAGEGSDIFSVGDIAKVGSVVGMTEINGGYYKVTASEATTVTLDVASTDFTTYSSAGTIIKIDTSDREDFANYFNITDFSISIDNETEVGRGLGATKIMGYSWDKLMRVTGSLSGELVSTRGLHMFLDNNMNDSYDGDLVIDSTVHGTTNNSIPSMHIQCQVTDTDILVLDGVVFNGCKLEISDDSAVKISADFVAHAASLITTTISATAPNSGPMTFLDGVFQYGTDASEVTYRVNTINLGFEKGVEGKGGITSREPKRCISTTIEKVWDISFDFEAVIENNDMMEHVIGNSGRVSEFQRTPGSLVLTVTKDGDENFSFATDGETAIITKIDQEMSSEIDERSVKASGKIYGNWAITGKYAE